MSEDRPARHEVRQRGELLAGARVRARARNGHPRGQAQARLSRVDLTEDTGGLPPSLIAAKADGGLWSASASDSPATGVVLTSMAGLVAIRRGKRFDTPASWPELDELPPDDPLWVEWKRAMQE